MRRRQGKQGSIIGDFCLIMGILGTAMGLFAFLISLLIRNG